MMNKTIHLKISGKVQGVYFRHSTQQKALELNISGWVRNCDDGSVELEAEGDEHVLKEFVSWCYVGPHAAAVSRVEEKTVEEKKYAGFEVRR